MENDLFFFFNVQEGIRMLDEMLKTRFIARSTVDKFRYAEYPGWRQEASISGDELRNCKGFSSPRRPE